MTRQLIPLSRTLLIVRDAARRQSCEDTSLRRYFEDVSKRQTLRRAFEGGPIVSHKLLNAHISEFMLDIKALPRMPQIQRLVRDRLQRLATRINSFVAEVWIWHRKTFCGPCYQNLRWNSRELNAGRK
jgi:hypothetical protein